jgi:bifunctional DNA-binding transcriptional regulator/antitoxin component of YhaV-PrlF toxin-antitoxin module
METEFKVRVGPQGHIYLPKVVREALGKELKIIPDAHAAAIYPADAHPQAIIVSLRLIIQDLKLHLEAEQRAVKNE